MSGSFRLISSSNPGWVPNSVRSLKIAPTIPNQKHNRFPFSLEPLYHCTPAVQSLHSNLDYLRTLTKSLSQSHMATLLPSFRSRSSGHRDPLPPSCTPRQFICQSMEFCIYCSGETLSAWSCPASPDPQSTTKIEWTLKSSYFSPSCNPP